jgi:hypothetical protein
VEPTANLFADPGTYRMVLDAIPLMLLIVDSDVTVLDMNATARDTLAAEVSLTQGLRGGDILRCIHALEQPLGCGHGSSCSSCIIRQSVGAGFRGDAVVRRRTKATLWKGDDATSLELLVTASPLILPSGKTVLLTIEDVTELSTLRNIIPICMHCKKIRNDDQYWQEVELYFRGQTGVDFSHGVCPDCFEKHYPGLAGRQDHSS